MEIWVPKWIRLALPEDVNQEISLSYLEYPNLTKKARQELITQKLRILRYEVWDREIRKKPKTPYSLRPSKLAKAKGYRKCHQLSKVPAPQVNG